MTSTRSGGPGSRTAASKRTAGTGRGSGTRPPRSGPVDSGRPWYLRTGVLVAVVAVLAVAVLYAVYSSANGADGSDPAAGGPAYDVGSPGPGVAAPDFTLPSSMGGTVSLADYRGKNVLLYFQEGLSCQPCWTQISDLEKAAGDVRAAGVDAVVSITTDPANLVAQKASDEGFTTTPVLSDPDVAVSRQYGTAGVGMMGGQTNGHSFVLVGPDGTIRWRADYGGAPNYTMYVPVKDLLADLRAGVAGR